MVLVIIASVCFMDHKKYISPEVAASIISGIFTIITFLGTVVAICITWKTNKEKSLLEVVTKNRANWVKEMKELFSKFFAKYDEEKIDETSDSIKGFEKDTLIKIRNEISLKLNPNGVIDNNILESLDNLIKNRDFNLRDRLEIKIKLYLKCEWERIKFETREGLEDYDFEYEFEKVQLINYILDKNVDCKLIKRLSIDEKIPYEFIRGYGVLNEEKINDFKEKIISRIKNTNFKKEKVIEFRKNLEIELS